MVNNQRGEIVTALVIAAFAVLTVATIASSYLTTDKDTRLTQATRASEYSGACKDNPASAPSGYTWKADCNKVCQKNEDCPQNGDPNVFAGTSNWCYGGFDGGARCLMLTKDGSSSTKSQDATQQANGDPIDDGSACKIGKACGIAACDSSRGGDPGHCSACDGGWCAGGKCATCGNKKSDTSGGTTSGGTSGGGTSSGGSTGGGTSSGGGQTQPAACTGNIYEAPSGGAQPNCSDFGGRMKKDDYAWAIDCGKTCSADSECQVNGASGWCYGFGDGKKCMHVTGSATGCTVQQVSTGSTSSGGSDTSGGGADTSGGGSDDTSSGDTSTGGGTSSGGGTEQETKPATCSFLVAVTDTDNNIVQGARVKILQETSVDIGTSNAEGLVRGGNKYRTGTIDITVTMTGYEGYAKIIPVDQSSDCNETVKLKKTTAPPPKCEGTYGFRLEDAQLDCQYGYDKELLKDCYKCKDAGSTGGAKPAATAVPQQNDTNKPAPTCASVYAQLAPKTADVRFPVNPIKITTSKGGSNYAVSLTSADESKFSGLQMTDAEFKSWGFNLDIGDNPKYLNTGFVKNNNNGNCYLTAYIESKDGTFPNGQNKSRVIEVKTSKAEIMLDYMCVSKWSWSPCLEKKKLGNVIIKPDAPFFDYYFLDQVCKEDGTVNHLSKNSKGEYETQLSVAYKYNVNDQRGELFDYVSTWTVSCGEKSRQSQIISIN